jgi:hypothetical protein
VIRGEVHASPTIGTPESPGTTDDKLFTRRFRQNDKARSPEPLAEIGRYGILWESFSTSYSHQEADEPQTAEVQG